MSDTKDGNMRFWSVLGKTDPSQTKKFKRSGGFTGTAIKPIYQLEKMTEVFGPAGLGWGTDQPVFQVVSGVNQEVLVYCTVGLWINPIEGGVPERVFGVGGDKVVSHIKANDQYNRPERWENDDEAFKKAFTDAVGNAMKHLGMSADVHMGLFDDSKYVREREAEERDGPQIDKEARTEASEPVPDAVSRKVFTLLQSDLMGAATSAQLEGVWERWLSTVVNWSELMQQNCHDVYSACRDRLAELDGDGRKASRDVIEAELRAAVSMEDLNGKRNKFREGFMKLGKDDQLYLSAVTKEMTAAIDKAGGTMPDFNSLSRVAANPKLTPEEEHAVRVAQTP